MGEQAVPEQVYRDAARAYVRRSTELCGGLTPVGLGELDQRKTFRAAVESAYRAGLAAAPTTDECDDKMPGIFGQPNLYCERPLGHRGWHQCGETKWRQTDG